MRQVVNWMGLVLVAAAAAILTFNTLAALAETCGFHGWQSWLLPISVDAAGGIATSVWLGGRDSPGAVRFARTWALTAIGVSLVGNATQHGLVAYGMTAPWWVAVAVAVIPPLALAGSVHLMVLLSAPADAVTAAAQIDVEPTEEVPEGVRATNPQVNGSTVVADLPQCSADRVSELLQAGVGRRTLAREAGVSEHEARKMIDASRNGHAQ